MAEAAREQILAALCEVLYISEADLVDGDETDLRDLGLDSVRFVLLMQRLGVERGSQLQSRLGERLSVAGWADALARPWPGKAE